MTLIKKHPVTNYELVKYILHLLNCNRRIYCGNVRSNSERNDFASRYLLSKKWNYDNCWWLPDFWINYFNFLVTRSERNAKKLKAQKTLERHLFKFASCSNCRQTETVNVLPLNTRSFAQYGHVRVVVLLHHNCACVSNNRA